MTTHHERDQESGLDYRGARFYDGDIGRFLSLDPLAMDFPSMSAYNYVLANPVFLVDPNGKSPIIPESWSSDNVWLATGFNGASNLFASSFGWGNQQNSNIEIKSEEINFINSRIGDHDAANSFELGGENGMSHEVDVKKLEDFIDLVKAANKNPKVKNGKNEITIDVTMTVGPDLWFLGRKRGRYVEDRKKE